MQAQRDLPEGLPHTGPFKHDSQQTLSLADHFKGIVRASGDFEQICLQWYHPETIRHLMQQVTSVSPVPDAKAWEVYTMLGRSGSLILPSHSSTDQRYKQDSQSLFSESDHHSTGVPQHDLVLGHGRPVIPDTIVSTQPS